MTQIIVLLVGLIGVAWRARTRRMAAQEWWIMGFVAASIFLVQLQMFVGENGKIQWILRYHQAVLTVLYGWAAWTVAEVVKAAPARWRKMAVFVFAAWFVSAGGTSLWRIVKHEFAGSSRNARNEAAKWAAELIEKDWQGPKADSERFFTVQEYHPRLRPVIQSIGARLPWLAKGRWYSLSRDVRKHEKPDYAFLPGHVDPPKGMELLAEKSFGKKQRKFRLFRSRRPVK